MNLRLTITLSLCLQRLTNGFVVTTFPSFPSTVAKLSSSDKVMSDEEPIDAANDDDDDTRPVALITGVSRSIGIGHAVVNRLVNDGYLVVAAGWQPYDERMPWGSDKKSPSAAAEVFDHYYQVDLEDPVATERLFPTVIQDVGRPVSALVLCHCESVDSDIFTTTVDSFDRHMSVNARATWQLIQGLARQYLTNNDSPRPSTNQPPQRLTIISITSDHTAGNLPYGASKGAMDRIVLAAAQELNHPSSNIICTANVINPGATDTGWMSPDIRRACLERNLQPRVGQPSDVANLVSFLCSEQGQWINGQILYSDGGLKSS